MATGMRHAVASYESFVSRLLNNFHAKMRQVGGLPSLTSSWQHIEMARRAITYRFLLLPHCCDYSDSSILFSFLCIFLADLRRHKRDLLRRHLPLLCDFSRDPRRLPLPRLIWSTFVLACIINLRRFLPRGNKGSNQRARFVELAASFPQDCDKRN